jgi:hypothetical protein
MYYNIYFHLDFDSHGVSCLEVYEYLFGNRASEWMNTTSHKMIINIYCAIHAIPKTIWQQLISNVKYINPASKRYLVKFHLSYLSIV